MLLAFLQLQLYRDCAVGPKTQSVSRRLGAREADSLPLAPFAGIVLRQEGASGSLAGYGIETEAPRASDLRLTHACRSEGRRGRAGGQIVLDLLQRQEVLRRQARDV